MILTPGAIISGLSSTLRNKLDSSLLRKSVNYDRNKFNDTGPWPLLDTGRLGLIPKMLKKIAADKHSSLFWLRVSDEDKKVFKRFHQIENDALTREVAILKETTKVSNI